MDSNKIVLLSQLVNSIRENYILLERAYNTNDKPAFDSAKRTLLEIQNKIDLVLK